MSEPITIEAFVAAPIDKVWNYWNEPEHITKWAFADESWEAPHAENNLEAGKTLNIRMQAKDGSAGFDLIGIYTAVEPKKKISYTLAERKVDVVFEEQDGGVKVVETFDPENENPVEMQRAGWQAILNNFKKHVENN